MQRFISYMYEYQREKKGRNVGFAKIDRRDNEYQVEIHLRNVAMEQGKGKIYLLYEDRGLMGVECGEIMLYKGCGAFSNRQSDRRMEVDLATGEIIGIGILIGEEGFLATRWKETNGCEFCRQGLQICEKKEDDLSTLKKQSQTPYVDGILDVAEPCGKLGDEREQAECQRMHSDFLQEDCDACREVRRIPEHEYEQGMRDQLWSKLQNRYGTEMQCPNGDDAIVCSDVVFFEEFPTQMQKLKENPFLLHGLLAHKKILLVRRIDAMERWYVGVPGYYERKEAMAACMFGFPEFMMENKESQKGYWLSELDMRLY